MTIHKGFGHRGTQNTEIPKSLCLQHNHKELDVSIPYIEDITRLHEDMNFIFER